MTDLAGELMTDYTKFIYKASLVLVWFTKVPAAKKNQKNKRATLFYFRVLIQFFLILNSVGNPWKLT